jgi:hypothetical protein
MARSIGLAEYIQTDLHQIVTTVLLAIALQISMKGLHRMLLQIDEDVWRIAVGDDYLDAGIRHILAIKPDNSSLSVNINSVRHTESFSSSWR